MSEFNPNDGSLKLDAGGVEVVNRVVKFCTLTFGYDAFGQLLFKRELAANRAEIEMYGDANSPDTIQAWVDRESKSYIALQQACSELDLNQVAAAYIQSCRSAYLGMTPAERNSADFIVGHDPDTWSCLCRLYILVSFA
jgi:hypothetical protein